MGYSDFGIKIRVQMLRKGIKGTYIAKELGISNAYFCDILKGARDGSKYKNRIMQILKLPKKSNEEVIQDVKD